MVCMEEWFCFIDFWKIVCCNVLACLSIICRDPSSEYSPSSGRRHRLCVYITLHCVHAVAGVQSRLLAARAYQHWRRRFGYECVCPRYADVLARIRCVPTTETWNHTFLGCPGCVHKATVRSSLTYTLALIAATYCLPDLEIVSCWDSTFVH